MKKSIFLVLLLIASTTFAFGQTEGDVIEREKKIELLRQEAVKKLNLSSSATWKDIVNYILSKEEKSQPIYRTPDLVVTTMAGDYRDSLTYIATGTFGSEESELTKKPKPKPEKQKKRCRH